MIDNYNTELNGDRESILEAEIKTITAERNRLETILSSLDTGLSLINPDHTIAWVNRKILEMFPDVDPIGKICHRFYESSDNKCEPCPTFQSFQSGCMEEIERFNPSNRRWYHIISQSIKNPDGQVINALEGVTDITERMQAEIKLAESERNMSTVLNNTHDVIVRIDRDFKHVFANSALYKATGVTPEQYLGKTNEEVGMPEQLCSFWRKKHQEVFATGKSDYFEFSYPTIENGERTFQAAVCPEFNDNKEVETICSFMRDITELRIAESEKDAVIDKLKKALVKAKRLSGLLPICSHCKKIRDDKGYWTQIESYIYEHSEADFSHSICPECAKEYYSDMDIFDEDDTQG